MGNLRTVKKNVRNYCNDLIGECIVAETINKEADVKKLADIVEETVKLKYDTLRKVSVSFDKAPRDFPNKAEYKKARKNYYKKVYRSLDSLFFKQIDQLIADLNKASKKDIQAK